LREVKITFGIIVLNGEPFTRYCIHALYQHAHEIIISEGACEGARNIATPDGHSQDGTLDILKEIKRLEDPENKIIIVTAEDEGHPDGFWPGEKHEQSRAYAKRATGNYLWQVDIDEFYKEEDIVSIKKMLENKPEITAVSFKQKQFWGGFDYTVDSWYLRRGVEEFHRVFKWGEGYQYKTHRPPTILNEKGQDTRAIKWMGKKGTSGMGIYLYHYSFVFPKQVFTKADYYSNSTWLSIQANDWASLNFRQITKPYKVFIITDYPSWLEKFRGEHPVAIRQLISDINDRKLLLELRETNDIEKLINSRRYKFGSLTLKLLEPVDRLCMPWYKKMKAATKKLIHVFK
jgi:hypothetical protein